MSEAAKHTPGPWNDGIYHAVTDGGRTYAYIRATGFLVPIAAVPLGVEGYGREEGEANARLIAAAPDMLAALKDALELAKLAETLTGCRADDDYVWGLRDKFAALISRAEPTLPADRKE